MSAGTIVVGDGNSRFVGCANLINAIAGRADLQDHRFSNFAMGVIVGGDHD